MGQRSFWRNTWFQRADCCIQSKAEHGYENELGEPVFEDELIILESCADYEVEE